MSVAKASLVAQMVKCLPAMQETWIRSLGWEDLLEKEMATHSNIFAWTIPWMEEPGRLQSHKESDTTEQLPSLTHSIGTQVLELGASSNLRKLSSLSEVLILSHRPNNH